MNIGQVLETHLGWAAAHGVFHENGDRKTEDDSWKLRRQVVNGGDPKAIATPVLDGATPEDVDEALIAWPDQNPESPTEMDVDQKRAARRKSSRKVQLVNRRTEQPVEPKGNDG